MCLSCSVTLSSSLWYFLVLCFLANAKANATEFFFLTSLKYSKLRVCYIHTHTLHFTTLQARKINRYAYMNQRWRETRLEGEQRRRKNGSPECVNLWVNEICVGLPNKPPSRHQLCPMLMRVLARCHGFAAGDFCACVRETVSESNSVI